jgi:hypothetical protein
MTRQRHGVEAPLFLRLLVMFDSSVAAVSIPQIACIEVPGSVYKLVTIFYIVLRTPSFPQEPAPCSLITQDALLSSRTKSSQDQEISSPYSPSRKWPIQSQLLQRNGSSIQGHNHPIHSATMRAWSQSPRQLLSHPSYTLPP